MSEVLGAIEAGGTKMVCAVGNRDGIISDRTVIPTTDPDETLRKMADYFRDKNIVSLGIGCFGPVDLDKESDTWGYILNTPKKGWKNTDVAGTFERELNVPVGIDTDVNCSLLGELTFGASKGIKDAVYLTVGTGIGAGIMAEGKLLHGMQHPEAGHIRLVTDPADDFEGICPFHKRCFEGLASGPAIKAKWGKEGFDLADRDEVWEAEAGYIAQALCAYALILSPRRIILGGGVMKQRQLFPLIRRKFLKYINGYLDTAQLKDIDNYIVPESLNGDQGILGALKLASNMMGGSHEG